MKRGLAAFLVMLAGVWVLASLLYSRPTIEVETPLILDFKDPGRGGGLAFYLACKQLWPGTRRLGWERDWQKESLVVISLARCEQSTLDHLLEWVRQGGRAVILSFQHERFIAEMGLDYLASSPAVDLPRGVVRTQLGPVLKKPIGLTTVFARQPYGKGEITVLVDPWIVSNDGLDRGENPHLTQFLVGEKATFLCPGSDLEWESLLLLSPWTRGAGGGVVLLVLLMVLNHNRPWGRQRFLPPPPPRSLMELVDAMAWLCQRAGAYQQVVDMVFRGAAVRLGAPLEKKDSPLRPAEALKLVREVQQKTAEAKH